MIKDAFGEVAHIGDRVAYAPGGAGAQEFFIGKIAKITERRVFIHDHGEADYLGNFKTVSRGAGCFVIKRGEDCASN